uniref:T-cell receptor alpha/delta variable 26.0 n=1 Tax=Mastacembelus armatus TaxID=205130 RepID=A0A3Q3LBS0_9TELE
MDNVRLMASFSLLFPGLTAGDTISPVEDEVTGREGESVKLTCRYQTDETKIYLYWYKHHSDLEAPQFILKKGAKGNTDQYIPDNRYESQTSDTSTELTIKSLTLADTALYYCLILFIHCGSLGHNELLPLFTILGNMEELQPKFTLKY